MDLDGCEPKYFQSGRLILDSDVPHSMTGMTNGHPGFTPAPLRQAINQAQVSTNKAIAAWNRDQPTIKAYDILEKNPDMAMSVQIGNGIVQGLAITSPYSLGTKAVTASFLLKGGLDAGEQLYLKGDIYNVDFIDAFVTGIPLPKSPASDFGKDITKSLFNFTLKTGFSMNKPEDAAAEIIFRQTSNTFLKNAFPNPQGFQGLGVDLTKKVFIQLSKDTYNSLQQ